MQLLNDGGHAKRCMAGMVGGRNVAGICGPSFVLMHGQSCKNPDAHVLAALGSAASWLVVYAGAPRLGPKEQACRCTSVVATCRVEMILKLPFTRPRAPWLDCCMPLSCRLQAVPPQVHRGVAVQPLRQARHRLRFRRRTSEKAGTESSE